MKLTRRLSALIACLLLRSAPRAGDEGDAARREGFSTHPGGKGLRFTQRLRSAFRRRWLRLRSH